MKLSKISELNNFYFNLADSKIKEIEAAAQAFGFFAAGFETTLSAITHCLYELSVNTDIQERTREDIDKNLEENNGKLDYEVLQNMHYLDKVVRGKPYFDNQINQNYTIYI